MKSSICNRISEHHLAYLPPIILLWARTCCHAPNSFDILQEKNTRNEIILKNYFKLTYLRVIKYKIDKLLPIKTKIIVKT